MSAEALRTLRARRGTGVVSVCSAHPTVIEAALIEAREAGREALIEATCNQVNQDGGYTGMTPAGFRDLVLGLAERVGLAQDRVVLGGDHLGPNPWKHLPPEQAMARAGDMVEAYARAGYEKLHLDASMGCAGEPAALGDSVVAGRAARLAARADAVARPVYVIGTEVPTPGGATEALQALELTTPDAVLETWEAHRAAFSSLPAAWSRVIALVVQPGVEFGHDAVAVYQPDRAVALSETLGKLPGVVFEAHSTDYQPEWALRRLVVDGFAILKVGPELTFAFREALYGLDAIRAVLRPQTPSLVDTMERLMMAAPGHWRSHYPGREEETRVLRHESYSDRIRYYWSEPEARAATEQLFDTLDAVQISDTLLHQHIPRVAHRISAGTIERSPRVWVMETVRDVLQRYGRAASMMEAG